MNEGTQDPARHGGAAYYLSKICHGVTKQKKGSYYPQPVTVRVRLYIAASIPILHGMTMKGFSSCFRHSIRDLASIGWPKRCGCATFGISHLGPSSHSIDR